MTATSANETNAPPTPFTDAASARVELWRRYDAGLLNADQLESRLQLVDGARSRGALVAAVDGVLPARRRVRPDTYRTVGFLALALVAVGVVVVGGLAYASVRESPNRVTRFAGGPATAFTAPAAAGFAVTTVPPATGSAPSCPAADAAIQATAGAGLGPAAALDAPSSDHLLADPPPAVPGYDVADDAEQLGAETDAAWAVAAGTNPAPTRTWVRTRLGEDRVEIHAYLYADRATALAVGHDSFVTGVCVYNGTADAVAGLPGSFVTKVTTVAPTAYTGFTFGPVRVVVAAFNADLDAAATHAIAVAEAEYQALAALPAPAGGAPPSTTETTLG